MIRSIVHAFSVFRRVDRPQKVFVFCALVLIAAILSLSFRADGRAAEPHTCLVCHQDSDLTKIEDNQTISLYVDPELFLRSVHGGQDCNACHADADSIPHASELNPVRCEGCHARAGRDHAASIHGISRGEAGTRAAACKDCHGHHDIQPVGDSRSRVYPLNLPRTCAKCHATPELARREGLLDRNVYELYMDSVHGRALTQAGLLVAAHCSSCHGDHDILPSTDSRSRVYRSNIPETCAGCHAGILDAYRGGIHGRLAEAGWFSAPVGIDCHTAHDIHRTEMEAWKLDIVRECGTCHGESERTFRDTFHGQVTTLGFTRVARCSDCHGSHDILPASDPQSSIYRDNLVATCGKCHAKANLNFVRYDPHADPKDKGRNPVLFYASFFMRSLLVGVFGFFGLHALMWALRAMIERGRQRWDKPRDAESGYFFRFSLGQRLLHGFLMLSFLGLVGTGMPLLYSDSGWAVWIAHAMGGFGVMGVFHRFFALILTVIFTFHLGHVIYRMIVRREKGLLWGPESLVPQPKDFADFYRNLLWFLGTGPRPRFGRYAYWEKFDYFAVFWGMAIIGSSGYLLWFHGFFSNWIPGWWFNVALLVHGEEALLAAGFIFTIHFFNTHLRPEKFPMDLVIFTGRIGEVELRHERPEEYALLSGSGRLSAVRADPPQRWLKNFGRVVGLTALSAGIVLLFLILIAIFGR